MKLLKINGYNNHKIVISCFDDIKKPKGIFIIIPDIKQTAKNYYSLARFLNDENFIVYISDLRLHGKTYNENNQKEDYEIKDDYFKNIVNDHLMIHKLAEERNYNNLPIIMLGHGFSSYIVKRFIEINDMIDLAILSGSGYNQSLTLKTLKHISQLIVLNKKSSKAAKTFEKYVYINYEKKFSDKNWLTYDDKVYSSYLNDETFNRTLPIEFYNSFFKNIMVKDKNLANIPNKTQVLLLSGADDPVHFKTKHLNKLFDSFKNANISTTMHIFDNMKHNIFEEKNKIELFEYIINYIKENLNTAKKN